METLAELDWLENEGSYTKSTWQNDLLVTRWLASYFFELHGEYYFPKKP